MSFFEKLTGQQWFSIIMFVRQYTSELPPTIVVKFIFYRYYIAEQFYIR
jgi:hypothetical protein